MASEPRTAPPLGPVAALGSLLTLGAVLVLAPVLWRSLPVTELPYGFAAHHQDAETVTFLLAFGVLLPLGAFASLRIADRIAEGPNAVAFSAVVALLTCALAVVVIAARLSTGVEALAAGAVLWGGGAAGVLWRTASSRPWALLAGMVGWTAPAWTAAGGLVGLVALGFGHLDALPRAAVASAVAIGVIGALLYGQAALPILPRRLARGLDVVVVAVLLLAVPQVAIFPVGDPTLSFDTELFQFHQNFFLGPANQVLAGDAMLVDVLSQYGVGSIYFLAGMFSVLPIGHGSLGLIEGGLSALVFVGTFASLRIAGVSRLTAATAMAVAVIVLVYGLQYPLGALLQHGAFRFGLPVGVVLGAVVESRWSRLAGPARGLQLVTLGVASVWALEAFGYTLLTAVAVAAVYVATLPPADRRRSCITWTVQIVGACMVAHLLFAGTTLAASGELPDWGWYVTTLRAFLVGEIGDWTYDFSSWSPGLAVGCLYVISASALSVVVVRRPDLRTSQRTLLIALGASTAYGVGLLSYLVNRSADHIIPYVCLPAVAAGALWLELLRRPAVGVPTAGQRAAVGVSLAVSILLTAAAWPSVDTRYQQSALAHAVPGGPSLAAALDEIRGRPALRTQAVEGEALLHQHLPGEDRSIVLTSADLAVEILLRAERGSSVPLGDPWEDSFVPERHLEPLDEFVSGLEAGDRLLLDATARAAFADFQRTPTLDPFEPDPNPSLIPRGLAPLQKWVLRGMAAHYDLRTLAVTESGLEVVELVPRPAGP